MRLSSQNCKCTCKTLDPSQVKIVDVIRETNPERSWSMADTIVTKPELKGSSVLKVKIEFSNELGTTLDEAGHTGRAVTGSVSINTKSLGNRLVAYQMEGKLEQMISQAAGGNMEIPAATLTSSAIAGEVPSWYHDGTEGADQSILSQLNIDKEAISSDKTLQDRVIEMTYPGYAKILIF